MGVCCASFGWQAILIGRAGSETAVVARGAVRVCFGHAHPPRSCAVKRDTRLVIIATVATLLVVLMLQNMRAYTLRFVVWEASIPFALLAPVLFLGGVLAGSLWRRR
jgi:uncharacterized integral membrane protein